MDAKRTPISHPLHWFPEFLGLGSRRLMPQARLLGLSLLVGVIAGLGAVVFQAATQIVQRHTLEKFANYHPRGPVGEPRVFEEKPPAAGESPIIPWMLLLLPTLGGLLSGLIVYTLAPEAEGHGTDSAIDAYHRKGGRIKPLVPLVKIVASSLTIGSGGSGGREGPIAQIGAGFGSFLGSLLRLRSAERRVLMAAGMGAGVAAIFRAPLAGALFAAEVLYRSPDFESEVIIPAALASITAYCTFGLILGHAWGPLFVISDSVSQGLTFDNPLRLGSYLLLALFVVVLAMIYTRSFYGLTYLFHHIPIKNHFKPAIGAFLTGAVGVALYFALWQNKQVLAVLSFGYGVLQDTLSEPTPATTGLWFALILLVVALGKILTTGLTIGSGGSGGVFGPSMVIGGCGGGALGLFLHWLWPPLAPQPASFVIVGMAGFFAAAAKTPLSTLVMVSELTGNYNLLLPTLWVCTIAFLCSDEQSIYSSQVESRSRSPAHTGAYVREVLQGVCVGQFLTKEVFPTLRQGDRLPLITERLQTTGYAVLPVVDDQGKLLGVISQEEVLVTTLSPSLIPLVVAADLMRGGVTPLTPEDRLDRALELFVESDLLALPVVDSIASNTVIGVVRRSDLSSTYIRYVQGVTSHSDDMTASA
jgi:chloride channel protein, CIC family